jgi:hypothetical protein
VNFSKNRTLASKECVAFGFHRCAALGGLKENSLAHSVNTFSELFLKNFRRKSAERTELLASFALARSPLPAASNAKGRGTWNTSISLQELFEKFCGRLRYLLKAPRLPAIGRRAAREKWRGRHASAVIAGHARGSVSVALISRPAAAPQRSLASRGAVTELGLR